jgi:hypothetical protein
VSDVRELSGKQAYQDGDTKTLSSTQRTGFTCLSVHVNRTLARETSRRDIAVAITSLNLWMHYQSRFVLFLSFAVRRRLKSPPTTIGYWHARTSPSSSPKNSLVLVWSAGPFIRMNHHFKLQLCCRMRALRKEPFLYSPTSKQSSRNPAVGLPSTRLPVTNSKRIGPKF